MADAHYPSNLSRAPRKSKSYRNLGRRLVGQELMFSVIRGPFGNGSRATTLRVCSTDSNECCLTLLIAHIWDRDAATVQPTNLPIRALVSEYAYGDRVLR